MRKKLNLAILLALALFCSSGCASRQPDSIEYIPDEQDSSVASSSPEEMIFRLNTGGRPMLITALAGGGAVSPEPCVEAYAISPDLSNVENLWQFHFSGEVADKLAQNGFVVSYSAGSEFFEIYEENRYDQIPSFVTVDSLMHTYHLYFSCLLKNIERDYLLSALTRLSERMLDDSALQYELLRGSEWEEAARRNVAFFTVGTALLNDGLTAKDYVQETVQSELDKIGRADGLCSCGITGADEDYTQYIPRGYYAGDERLERYFRAMMWYGRMHFFHEEELDRSALLISLALSSDSEAYRLWEAIYAVTSFFAGASDDAGVCEYAPVIREIYGGDITIDDLTGNQDAFERFRALAASLPIPGGGSLPAQDGQDKVFLGFRFMGQRFTIDAAVMQSLIYSSVGENSAGDMRMLPDVLDVPAALGSDVALGILEESGATDYAGYQENMEYLREILPQENEPLWSASLYAGWLNTLRPLLDVRGEGYPMFMQGEEWAKKNLECFAGSFTELKHDTILYSKQVLAEMGGGPIEEVDYGGYVEPEPLVYQRFSDLAELTAQGLEKYGMLGPDDRANLYRLSHIADLLQEISVKELTGEALTEQEYEFIKGYGGSLEHFWYEAVKNEDPSGGVSCDNYPAALVVDIATDPGGTVLEAATDNPSLIYAAVEIDGKLVITRGSVYSFYQFAWPMDDRLTDSKWRVMMGLEADENGFYSQDIPPVQKPEWTDSYRFEYE